MLNLLTQNHPLINYQWVTLIKSSHQQIWHITDCDALAAYLPKLSEQYNNKPHSALFGFTPKEVFNGMIPSKFNFLAAIDQNKIDRVTYNKEKRCMSC